MIAKSRQLPTWIGKPVDSRMLGLYRIGYGLFMVYTMLNYFRIELVKKMFVEPHLNFSYDYLYWIKPLPESVMNVIIGLLAGLAVCISLGLFFKWSCRIFALGYAYIFLIDKSIYNNHIYLFILLAILLSFTDADNTFTLKRIKHKFEFIPQWQVLILQFQIVIVYFYGGLAKLTKDWLIECQPARTVVAQFPDDGVWSHWLKTDAVVYIINYGGVFIDLGAPLLLWYKPLRRWAIFVFIAFNALNSRIFSDIGIFPYVMLVSLFLFYEVSELPWLSSLLRRLGFDPGTERSVNRKGRNGLSRLKMYGIGGYFVFQLLFPFRGHFLPNDLDYTTIGNRFSWRMKVDTRKVIRAEYTISSPDFPSPVPVEIQTFINDVQINNLTMDPRSVLDFGKFIHQEAIKYDTRDPEVYANIEVEYNGRSPQKFVDPAANLAKMNYSPFKLLPWVVPIKTD